ncbi:hypothetical protein LEN26_015962 [Aphanomyces euteiches]|nr:hypothetical protein LEN26_015962 [Aphanomyces euteiches]KAH9113225.1 hypothetical protein AeMF1_012498 [Aphanomyces euteiches]
MCRKMTADFSSEEPQQEESIEGSTLELSPFLQACEDNDLEVVKQLVNATELNLGLTMSDCLDVVEFLLSCPGADENFEAENGLTPLIFACACGNIGVVKRLLVNNKLNLNHQNRDGVTALMVATSMGHLSIVKLLFQQPKLNLNLVNQHGVGPFVMACTENLIDIASFLLKNSENNGVVIGEGFIAASKNGHLDVVKMLTGLDILELNHLNRGFYEACLDGSEAVVEYLIQNAPIDINFAVQNESTDSLFPQGMGTFAGACAEDHPTIAALLMQHPNFDASQLNAGLCLTHDLDIVDMILADPRLDINDQGVASITSLVYACTDGSTNKVARLLRANDLDVDILLDDGINALMMACSNGHLDIVELLVADSRVDLSITSHDNMTAFGMACLGNHVDIVKLLLQLPQVKVDMAVEGFILAFAQKKMEVVQYLIAQDQIDLDEYLTTGRTLFLDACSANAIALVNLLIQASIVDVNKVSKGIGMTPFMEACSKNAVNVVARLLQIPSVEINAINSRGATPLILASTNGCTEVVSLLVTQPQLNINYKNPKGSTALTAACAKHHVGVVAELLKHPTIDITLPNHVNRTPAMLAKGNPDITALLQLKMA